jgi:hypothetical protein
MRTFNDSDSQQRSQTLAQLSPRQLQSDESPSEVHSIGNQLAPPPLLNAAVFPPTPLASPSALTFDKPAQNDRLVLLTSPLLSSKCTFSAIPCLNQQTTRLGHLSLLLPWWKAIQPSNPVATLAFQFLLPVRW